MKVEGLRDFQEKVMQAFDAYKRYLTEDLEACYEEGEMDYARQRDAQLIQLRHLRERVNPYLASLTPFKE